MSSLTTLVHDFPKGIDSRFNLEMYQKQFENHSFIVNATADKVEYPKHWGLLSIKCAFNGTEYYEAANGFYGVNDSNFLIFNEGTIRSSYISSAKPVHSFSISFSPSFVSNYLAYFNVREGQLLDDSFHSEHHQIEFTERLHPHNELVSPLLIRLKRLSENQAENNGEIEETLSLLFGSMIATQKHVWRSMKQVASVRASTQKELYTRLHRAKDYISSCFKKNLTLDEIAGVACLNRNYFLREFKKLFQHTPHQYLIELRLTEAYRILASSDKGVAEICNEVGYSDIASFSKLFKKRYQYPPSKNRFKKRAVL